MFGQPLGDVVGPTEGFGGGGQQRVVGVFEVPPDRRRLEPDQRVPRDEVGELGTHQGDVHGAATHHDLAVRRLRESLLTTLNGNDDDGLVADGYGHDLVPSTVMNGTDGAVDRSQGLAIGARTDRIPSPT